jgi:hypothetical protein
MTEAPGCFVFSAAVSSARPSEHCTPRRMPQCDGVAAPLQDARILWQR